MEMTSRREFLQASTLAATLCAAARGKQLQAIGVQLYTVRTVLPQKPAEVLGAIDEIGYQEAEATYAGLDTIWSPLVATRLKPVSIHLDSALVTKGKDEDIARTFAELRHRGFSYAVFPYLPPAERLTASTYPIPPPVCPRRNPIRPAQRMRMKPLDSGAPFEPLLSTCCRIARLVRAGA